MKKKLILFIILSFVLLGIFLTAVYYKEIKSNVSDEEVSIEESESVSSVSTEKTSTSSVSKKEVSVEEKVEPQVSENDTKTSASTSTKKDKEEKQKEPLKKGTAAGALSVSGSSLVNASGEVVQLKGLSTHGIAWFPDYINKNLFKEFSETWNCNVIRLAMYTAEYGGYCNGGDRNNLLTMIDNGVTYATEQGMYVIIDWHILSDSNPNTNKADALDFFKTVSKKYASNTHVIYEICNEPNGSTNWSDIKSYALEVIPVIRENSPDSIIIVGTPTWSQEVDKAAADPITEYGNIMYALHFYADTHRDGLRKTLEKAVNAGLPVFVTEYGICDASGSGAINESEAGKWMSLLDKYSISSCAWNISNKGETSAIFKSSCNKTYGFSDSDLSDSGKWVFKMLTGQSTYDSSSVSFSEPPKAPDQNQGNQNNSQNNQNNNQNTASKTISSQSGPVSVTLSSTSSWESDGKTFTQYNVTVTNTNGFDINSWTGEVTFNNNIEMSQSWCANFSIEGKTLRLSNADFNGYLKAGESTRDIGCILIEY